MNLARQAVAIVLLVVGVNLQIEHDGGLWGLVAGGCLGAFAGMAVDRR